MARVTVEDCIINVPNRFELVLLGAKRAREISAGAPLTVARDNDKNAVVALREISENSIDIENLRQKLIRGMSRFGFSDEQDQNNAKEIYQDTHEDDDTVYTDQLVEQDLESNTYVNVQSDDDMEDIIDDDDGEI